MKLGDPGVLNAMAKRATPYVGITVNALRATRGVELMAAYLNLLAGKGCGSGWDKGEEVAAARVIRARGEPQRPPVVIDCGGNRGTWTREVRARLESDAGRWIVIEPAPESAALCRQLPNVEVVEAAAGEHPATLDLYSNEAASGWASLHERGDSFARGARFTTRQVPVVTLDSVIAEKDIRIVDFLKLDIEGHELFALRGTRRALAAGMIRALSFEFGSGNVNSRTYFRDFWDLLVPLGYELHRILPGGRTFRVAEYDEDLENFRGVTNYIGLLKAMELAHTVRSPSQLP